MENLNWFGYFLYYIGAINESKEIRLWHPFVITAIPILIVMRGTVEVFKELSKQGTWKL
jgi:hypothetical protein